MKNSAFGGSATSLAAERPQTGWHSRPVLAALVRLLVFALPIVAAIIVVRVCSPALPAPRGVVGWIAWLCSSAVVALATVTVVDRLARRLLPLATLLHMSLVFPDDTPSRMRLALRSGTARDLQRRISEGESLGETADEAAQNLLVLLRLLNDHDRLTRGHSERVRAFADLIAEEMDLPVEDRALLHWGALAHDVGKLSVAPELLNKAGTPTDAEWRELRNHPLAAFELAAPLRPWLGPWVDAATQHHERFDGGGYPLGLSGSDIHLSGRIVAVADAFDTMTSARSYKKPLAFADARAELARNAGTQFDPEVVRAFMGVGVQRLRLVAGPLAWITSLPTTTAVTTVTTTSGGAGAALAGAAVAVSAVVGLGAPTPPESGSESEETAGVERVIETVAPTTSGVDAATVVSSTTTSPVFGTVTSTAPTSTTSTTTTSTTTTSTTTTSTTTTSTTTTSTTTTSTTTTTPPGQGKDCGAVQAGLRPLAGLELANCDLGGFDLFGEDLTGADLSNADLSGADLRQTTADGADLSGADLSGADLREGDFKPVNFSGADLRGADLRIADFDGSTFSGADLTDVKFEDSSLDSVSLVGATLRRAKLDETDIGDADFTNAFLVDASGEPDNSEAATWSNTTCPNGVVQSTNCFPD